MSKPPKKGDYVLATKYADGCLQDGWCVGFYDREVDYGSGMIRHMVVDENGQQFRHNGFRRVKRISPATGDWFVLNRGLLEHACYSAYHYARMWRKMQWSHRPPPR